MGQNFRYTEDTSIRKDERTMEYKIVWVKGHVEVYDHMGRFCFSADNKREALEELKEAS